MGKSLTGLREHTGMILTLGARDQGLEALLLSPDGQSVTGQLSAQLLEEVQGAFAALKPPTGLLLPELGVQFQQQEQRLAQQLWRLLTTGPMRRIGRRMKALCTGAMPGTGDPGVAAPPSSLLIDARTGPLRHLPWELLESLHRGDGLDHLESHRDAQLGVPPESRRQSPLESHRTAEAAPEQVSHPPGSGPTPLKILRVVGGSRGRRLPPRACLEVVLWMPDPNDPIWWGRVPPPMKGTSWVDAWKKSGGPGMDCRFPGGQRRTAGPWVLVFIGRVAGCGSVREAS